MSNFNDLTTVENTNLTANFEIDELVDNSHIIFNILHYMFLILAIAHLLYFLVMIIYINCVRKRLNKNQGNSTENKKNDDCTICLQSIKNEVQLLCFHSYCSDCLNEFKIENQKIKCPICAQPSILIVINFNKTYSGRTYNDFIDYNRKWVNGRRSSICFFLDLLKFFIFQTKNIIEFRNQNVTRHRKCLIIIKTILLLLIIIPHSGVTFSVKFLGDIFFYSILVFLISESFFRRIVKQIDQNSIEIMTQIEISQEEKEI